MQDDVSPAKTTSDATGTHKTKLKHAALRVRHKVQGIQTGPQYRSTANKTESTLQVLISTKLLLLRSDAAIRHPIPPPPPLPRGNTNVRPREGYCHCKQRGCTAAEGREQAEAKQ